MSLLGGFGLIEVLTFLLIGAIGGFLAGLIGLAGGVVLIPLLIYLGKTSIEMATSISIVVIMFVSFSGFLAYRRRGNVHVSTGLWMGVAGVAGALAGSLLSKIFSVSFFYTFYIGLVAVAAVMLAFPGPEVRAPIREHNLRKLPIVLVGLFKGFITGVLGVGGNFIILPLMVRVLDMPIHKAVGTSLVCTLFAALAGLAGKLAIGHFNIYIAVCVVLGAIPATYGGAWAAHKSSPRSLRLFLLTLLVLILVRMLWNIVQEGLP